MTTSAEMVRELLQVCRDKGMLLRTVESCTAGGVSLALASIAGASDVLDRAWVTYSNEAKIQEVAVPAQLIEEHGAVSEAVVSAMALGGAAVNGSASNVFCIAISGIAGPSGGSLEKPVGTVWMAVANFDQIVQSQKFLFQGERESIQMQATNKAIALLLSSVRN